jgi:hypothetical protein
MLTTAKARTIMPPAWVARLPPASTSGATINSRAPTV